MRITLFDFGQEIVFQEDILTIQPSVVLYLLIDKMSKYRSLNNLLIILIIFSSCGEEKEEQETQEIFYPLTNDFLVDHNATEQTVALYEFLRDFSGNGTIVWASG